MPAKAKSKTMVNVKILTEQFKNGQPLVVGRVYQVTDTHAKLLVGLKAAELVTSEKTKPSALKEKE